MSTKLIKKEELTYKNGYLTDKEGNVVSTECIGSLNCLERVYQKALHNINAKESMVKPTAIKPFEFESEHDDTVVIEKPETPALDKRAAEALEFLKETNAEDTYKRASFISKRFAEVNEFVNNNLVCISDKGTYRLDLKLIRNPLKLTKARLAEIYETIAEADGE